MRTRVKPVLLYIILLTYINAAAQKRDNNWALFSCTGLNFNYNPPQSFISALDFYSSNVTGSAEASATISDRITGQLLFYGTADRLYDVTGTIMQNGDNLYGETSTTQGALVVPFPADTSKYYFFYMPAIEDAPGGFYYAVIDMNLNIGLGGVDPTQKNVPLWGSFISEKLQAVSDCTGTGYWVVMHEMNSNCFQSYHVTASGIAAGVESCAGLFYSSGLDDDVGVGQMKISPNGKMLAVADYEGLKDSIYGELFDFDNSTGIVTNPRQFWTGSAYGIEFSPDNSKLYVTAWVSEFQTLPPVPSKTDYLFQFDLQNGGSNLNDSRVIIDSSSIQWLEAGLQLGPDGKIYDATNQCSVITNPNKAGALCGYSRNNFVLPFYYSFLSDTAFQAITLPNVLVELPPSITSTHLIGDTSVCPGTSFKIQLGDEYQSVLWSNGTSGNTFSTDSPGRYYFVAQQGVCGLVTDTFSVNMVECNNLNIGIPNAFTPNNDGKNDLFYPLFPIGIELVEFKIFNRWGELLYSDPTHGWNGKFKGIDQSPGVYVYYAQFTAPNANSNGSQTLMRKGSVALLR